MIAVARRTGDGRPRDRDRGNRRGPASRAGCGRGSVGPARPGGTVRPGACRARPGRGGRGGHGRPAPGDDPAIRRDSRVPVSGPVSATAVVDPLGAALVSVRLRPDSAPRGMGGSKPGPAPARVLRGGPDRRTWESLAARPRVRRRAVPGWPWSSANTMTRLGGSRPSAAGSPTAAPGRTRSPTATHRWAARWRSCLPTGRPRTRAWARGWRWPSPTWPPSSRPATRRYARQPRRRRRLRRRRAQAAASSAGSSGAAVLGAAFHAQLTRHLLADLTRSGDRVLLR